MAVKIKFFNDSDEDLTIGLFGENNFLTFRITIQGGGRHTQTFQSGGDRVLVAWDEFTDEFFPSADQAVKAQTFGDGDKVKARIDDSGWSFALLAPGSSSFGDIF